MDGLTPLHKRVAGIDVHRMLHVVTVLIEGDDGTIIKHLREFGGFKRDMKTMAFWLLELHVSLVVMESTGIYGSVPCFAMAFPLFQSLPPECRIASMLLQ